MRVGAILIILCIFGAVCAVEAADGRRFALVMGNGAYDALPRLPQAVEEARQAAVALREAGFDVTSAADFRMPEFLSTFEVPFLQKLRAGDICFVYFSGYALHVVDEDNYLLPINFKPADDRDMHIRAYRLRRLQNELEDRQVQLKIFALEAPPLLTLSVKGADVSQGLMAPNLGESHETLFAFATQPGQTITPGSGLFTRFLAENMRKPGMQPGDLFHAVKQDVGRESGLKQIPYVNDNIVARNIFFHPPEKVKPPEKTVIREEVIVMPPGFPARNPKDNEEYVWIPGGVFKMGCVPTDTRCKPEEKPQHQAAIKGFWMGRNEVRVSSYRLRFLESVNADAKKNGERAHKMPPAPLYNKGWSTTDMPMVLVSWEDARDFCAWAGGRLPTEGEWEFAARAGKTDEIYPLNDENSRNKANFAGELGNDHWAAAAPVRSFDPNAFSLFDMAGNVWEWVNDFYSPDYYASAPASQPRGPERGKERVVRGGSFHSDPKEHLRLSFRKAGKGGSTNVGFRCALDDTPLTKALLGR